MSDFIADKDFVRDEAPPQERRMHKASPATVRNDIAKRDVKRNENFASGGSVESPPTLNAMQYYAEGDVVTPTPYPSGSGFIPDDQFTPDAQVLAQAPTQTQDSDIDASSQPGFIPDDQFEPDSEHYTSYGQQTLAALEGAAQGLVGPVAPALEEATGLTSAEDIRNRAQYNPELETVSKLGSFAGSAYAGLPFIAKGLGVASEAALAKFAPGLVETGASYSARIGAGALKGALEMGLLSASDETTRAIVQDPTTSMQTAMADIGLNTALGLGAGGFFGGAERLLEGGAPAKAVQELENFKGQMAYRTNVPEPVTEMGKELSARYNEISEIFQSAQGTNGLKEGAIAKTVPPQVSDSMLAQAGDTFDLMNQTLAKMKAKPTIYPARLVNKLEDDISNYKNTVFPEAPTKAPVSPSDQYTQASDQATRNAPTENPDYAAARQKFLESRDPFETSPTNAEIDAATKGISKTITPSIDVTPPTELPSTAPSATSFDIFKAQQDLKQMVQGYSRIGTYIKPHEEAYDFIQALRGIGPKLKTALEDDSVWGDAATLQKNINQSWSNFKPFYDQFEKTFTETVPQTDLETGRVTLQPRVSLSKIQTYANQAGTVKDAAKKSILKGFLDGSEDLHAKTLPAYSAIGEESPFTSSPMVVTRQSLGELTPGMKAANATVDLALGKGAARTLAGGVGSTLGGTLGGVIGGPAGAVSGATAGALIGERAFGPYMEKMLPIIGKPFFENVANWRGFRAAGRVVEAATKAQRLMSQSAKNVFKAGAEVLPASAIPSLTAINKLNTQVLAAQDKPDQFAQNATNNSLGVYMPNHAQAFSQTLANAVGYINSQRPNTTPQAPLDGNRIPSAVKQGAFQNLLTIAQQPLTMYSKVQQGTITPDDVKHMSALYPAAYDAMKMQLSHAMTDQVSKGGAVSIPYKTRIGMSLFLGQGVDSTLTPSAIQSAQPTPNATPAPQPPKTRQKSSTKDLHNVSDQALTPLQARQKHEDH